MAYLDVPYFKQDTGYTCGPTSLQMVLAYYGLRESEAQLAKELETEMENGTCHQNMITSALERGFHCYVNDNSSLEEIGFLLAHDIPLIVHFLEPTDREDHYSVVVGLTGKDVVLNDPWNGEREHLSRRAFVNRWTCDEVGRCKEWLMAIMREPLPLGKQYHPYVD